MATSRYFPSTTRTVTAYNLRKINHDLRRGERSQLWKNFYGSVQETQCVCCGDTVLRRDSPAWHAGHIVAEARGGVRDLYNRVPECVSCNQAQGQRNVFDWMWLNRRQHLYPMARAVHRNYGLDREYDAQYVYVWQTVLHRFSLWQFPRGGIQCVDDLQFWLQQGEAQDLFRTMEQERMKWDRLEQAHEHRMQDLMVQYKFIARD